MHITLQRYLGKSSDRSLACRRCVETCHLAQAQQIIPRQEDLDMFPQILVHQTRAQTKSNLILKTVNRISEHCGMTRDGNLWCTQPKMPQNRHDEQRSLPTREPEQGTPQETILQLKNTCSQKKHKQELRCGDPQNEVQIIPRFRRYSDGAPVAEKRGETCKP